MCDELQVMFSNRPSLCLFTIHRQGLATNTPLAAVKEKNLNSNKTHFIVLFRFIVLLYYIWYTRVLGWAATAAPMSWLQSHSVLGPLLVLAHKLHLMGVYLWQVLVLHYLNFSKRGRWWSLMWSLGPTNWLLAAVVQLQAQLAAAQQEIILVFIGLKYVRLSVFPVV